MLAIWLKTVIMVPQKDDKILIFKEKWLTLILDGKKTLEIRGRRFKEGSYWMGHKSFIYGRMELGTPTLIRDIIEWDELRDKHCVETDTLPYRKTWAFKISNVKKVGPFKFKQTRGTVSIARYQ